MSIVAWRGEDFQSVTSGPRHETDSPECDDGRKLVPPVTSRTAPSMRDRTVRTCPYGAEVGTCQGIEANGVKRRS